MQSSEGDGTKHEHAVLISAWRNLAKKKVGVTNGFATQVFGVGAGARFCFCPGCDMYQISSASISTKETIKRI
jgi:hypothetical protein